MLMSSDKLVQLGEMSKQKLSLRIVHEPDIIIKVTNILSQRNKKNHCNLDLPK